MNKYLAIYYPEKYIKIIEVNYDVENNDYYHSYIDRILAFKFPENSIVSFCGRLEQIIECDNIFQVQEIFIKNIKNDPFFGGFA